MAGALIRSASGSFLSATGQGSVAGSQSHIAAPARLIAPRQIDDAGSKPASRSTLLAGRRVGRRGRGSAPSGLPHRRSWVGMPLERNRPKHAPPRRPRRPYTLGVSRPKSEGTGWGKAFARSRSCMASLVTGKLPGYLTYLVFYVKNKVHFWK